MIQLIPNILSAIECDCSAFVDDLLKVVNEILSLVVGLLEGEGTLLAQFLASLIEVVLGGAAATNGVSGLAGVSVDTMASEVYTPMIDF